MKYMGSKMRLSKDLAPIMQEIIDMFDIDTYVEPFVGGANIIDVIECESRIGYDNNEYLIEFWNRVQDGWKIPDRVTREQYENIRDNRSDYPKEMVAVAGILSTYNAKWFGGYAAITHTKAGTIRDYYDESKRNVEKQLPNVMDVKFKHSDYRNIEYDESLIYCDPPYQGRTGYGSDFNHDEYWEWVRSMSKNNIVICSEYNAPDDFIIIYEKGLTTTMDNASRKKDVERLFIHKSLLQDCPRCKNKLIYTPLEQYNSQCLECDEDFGYMYVINNHQI